MPQGGRTPYLPRVSRAPSMSWILASSWSQRNFLDVWFCTCSAVAVGPAEGMCVYFAGALGPAGISSLYLYHLALTEAFPGTPRLSQPGTLWDKKLRELSGGIHLQVEYPFSKMLECFRCLNFFPPDLGLFAYTR